MQGSVRLEICLYGAFRAYVGDGPLILDVPVGLRPTEIKARIGQALQVRFPGFAQQRLIESSALADERTVLTNDHVLACDASLALLPPVCGG